MKIYLVGGAVRDKLLNRPQQDRDWVVVGATPQQMLDLGYKAVGNDFPVFLHPKTGEEYALARTERKHGKGYHGFTFFTEPTVAIEQDLIRRDLTINAIASSDDGELVDPFGGLNDLRDKKLRHVSPAFAEDPLRVLRVARFYSRYAPDGFTIADETIRLMTDIVDAGEMQHLTPERVWMETEKALSEPRAALYFSTLRQCGALAILFPEIEALFEVPNPGKWHPEVCTGVHTFLAIEQMCHLSSDPVERFATLCHDLGKALTPEDDLPSHPGHEKAGSEPILALCERLRAPNKYRDLARVVSLFHTHIHRLTQLKPTTIVKMFQSMDAFRKPERVTQLARISQADASARPVFCNFPYPNAQHLVSLFNEAQQINAGEIAKNCGNNKALIPKRVYEARVANVKQALRQIQCL